MVSRVKTVAFQGIDVVEIDVQTHLASGLPAFNIVGLADKAVAESKERVRSSLSSIGLALPAKRVTVNLAPADIQKEGSHYDLAIALGLLLEMQVLEQESLNNFIVMGELALDGTIGPASGVIPAAIHAAASGKGLICPKPNGGEARWSGNSDIIAAPHLLTLINHLKGSQILAAPELPSLNDNDEIKDYPDMAEIIGQETAKRAIEIAASGGHNILMVGPPGSGKSMLAKALKGILPELSAREILEVAMIKSVTGNLEEGKISKARPFRDPHHSCSMPAMIGGGMRAKPGEVTMSHNGILFLDELPEYPRQVLDSLRQPIENGKVTVSRVNSHVTYPANFQLVAAMNPCRCGHLGDNSRACGKAPKCAVEYQSKISGPLFDRIDLTIEVPAVEIASLHVSGAASENTMQIAERVAAVRNIQEERLKEYGISTNAEMSGEVLNKFCALDDSSRELLNKAAEKNSISMRSYSRILKVARTIADVEGSKNIAMNHLAEAIGYHRQIA